MSLTHASRNYPFADAFIEFMFVTLALSPPSFDTQPHFVWHSTNTACWLGLKAGSWAHRSSWSLCVVAVVALLAAAVLRGKRCALQILAASVCPRPYYIYFLLSTLCWANFITKCIQSADKFFTRHTDSPIKFTGLTLILGPELFGVIFRFGDFFCWISCSIVFPRCLFAALIAWKPHRQLYMAHF